MAEGDVQEKNLEQLKAKLDALADKYDVDKLNHQDAANDMERFQAEMRKAIGDENRYGRGRFLSQKGRDEITDFVQSSEQYKAQTSITPEVEKPAVDVDNKPDEVQQPVAGQEGLVEKKFQSINGLSEAESLEVAERVKRIEAAMASVIPTLNTMTKTEEEIPLLGKLDISVKEQIAVPENLEDGVWSGQSAQSFDAMMKHLGFLVDMQDLSKVEGFAAKAQAGVTAGKVNTGVYDKTETDVSAFLNSPAQVEKLKTLLGDQLDQDIADLKGKTSLTEADKTQLEALEKARAELPQVLDDAVYLNQKGLLAQAHSIQEQTQMVSPTDPNAGKVEPQLDPDANAGNPNPQGGATNPGNVPGAVQTQVHADLANYQNAFSGSSEGLDLAGKVLEEELAKLGEIIPKKIGGIQSNLGKVDLSQFGIDLSGLGQAAQDITAEFVLSAEEADGVWDNKSDKALAVALVSAQALAGIEGGTGEWNNKTETNVIAAIYTSETFADLRAEMKINALSPEAFKNEFMPAYDGYQQSLEALRAEGASDILNGKGDPAKQKEMQAHLANVQGFEKKYNYEGIRVLTDAIDVVTDKKNNPDYQEKAKKYNQDVLMGRAVMAGLDQIGMGGFVRDFFESDFGKMLKPFLEMFGIDIDFMLGKTEVPANEEELSVKAQQDITTKFSTSLDEAEGASVQEKLDNVIADYKEDNSGYKAWLGKKATAIVVGSENVELAEEAIEKGFEAAKLAAQENDATLDDVKSAFSQAVYAHVQDPNNKAKPVTPESRAKATREAFDGMEEQDRNNVKQTIAANSIDLGDGVHVKTRVELDPDAVAGRNNIDPTRYADQNVTPLTEFLIKQGAALGLDADNLAKLTDENGKPDSLMTPEFCAGVEEMWVRANIAHGIENNIEVTPEYIAGLDKFNPYDVVDGKAQETDHLAIMRSYIEAELGQEGLDEFNKTFDPNLEILDSEFGRADNGQQQKITVWDQSYYEGQVKSTFPINIKPEPLDEEKAKPDYVPPEDNIDEVKAAYLAGQPKENPCPTDPNYEEPVFMTDDMTNNVYVLIRGKNGTPSRDDDTFKKLTLEDYKTNGHDIPDDIVQALIDNYTWQGELTHKKNPEAYTQEMQEAEIRAHIDCLLGKNLEPIPEIECAVNAIDCSAPDPKPEPEKGGYDSAHDLNSRYIPKGVGYDRPEVFSDLPALVYDPSMRTPQGLYNNPDTPNDSLALGPQEVIADAMGLPKSREEVLDAMNVDSSRELGGSDNDTRLYTYMLAQSTKHGGAYTVFDFKQNGIDPVALGVGDEVDAVVLSSQGTLSFIDYDKQGIIPVTEQAARDKDGLSTGNYAGDRRLDEILSVYALKTQVAGTKMTGFGGMGFVMPDGNVQNGISAVYGNDADAISRYKNDYVKDISNPRSSYITKLNQAEREAAHDKFAVQAKFGNATGQAVLTDPNALFEENLGDTTQPEVIDLAFAALDQNAQDLTGSSFNKSLGFGATA